ncbi:MAG: phage major capsid protein, partial [Steroidobacteraceae bacterium]|nr:phage major capsid protein [Steroidobacteraceae bacterium]MDW8259794.1 phage major capsid protein [Gammaproteobacteria bacterium]
LKDSNNQYLWQPGLTLGQPPTLVGYPVTMAADMPMEGAGAIVAIFGSMARADTIVDRLGITVQRNPYRTPGWMEYHTRRRVGGDVVNFQALKLLVCSA